MESELIVINEYSSHSKIELQFIILLEEEGLIQTQWIEGKQYLQISQLGDIEKYASWYYDLSINIEGIDAIQRLLGKMEIMQEELRKLKRFLKSYENRELSDFDNDLFN